VLADQDIEDHSVDGIVEAVQGDGTDGRGALTEPVDAAFTLLVPRRVPREVVEDDGGEVALKVDALRQAVGGNLAAGSSHTCAELSHFSATKYNSQPRRWGFQVDRTATGLAGCM
jgi:hypothetical protein